MGIFQEEKKNPVAQSAFLMGKHLIPFNKR